uniref:protein phosphatase 1H-like n=1 Tax=Myxine glutinosa TaxID=7769 RepID=UPI00358FE771
MLSRVRSVVSSLVGGLLPGPGSAETTGNGAGSATGDPGQTAARFSYGRPDFLNLNTDELECSADHMARPILIPREAGRKMPWNTGYAEVINAGKSTLNEDQAVCEVVFVKRSAEPIANRSTNGWSRTTGSVGNGDSMEADVQMDRMEDDGVTFIYWALFDGHAGAGASLMAANLLHHHVAKQLQGIVELLRSDAGNAPICLDDDGVRPRRPSGQASAVIRGVGSPPPTSPGTPSKAPMEKEVTQDALVIGAIENAFREMDQHIERDKTKFHVPGGCTSLFAMYVLGKLYIANAGDSRAIIIRGGEVVPLTGEFTPETERQRLQYLAHLQPHLLGDEFSALEFPRRVQRKELGKKMLYRDHTMVGWSYKTIEENDLKFPLVYGEGKKARVMATIGVTRGLGDHDLKVYDSNISIKPFLSCVPEVRIYELATQEHTPNDVLIIATDGLWDVLSNDTVCDLVSNFLENCDPSDPNRYTLVAQELVMKARGVLRDKGWRISNEKLGSGDDISVFLFPLHYGNRAS